MQTHDLQALASLVGALKIASKLVGAVKVCKGFRMVWCIKGMNIHGLRLEILSQKGSEL